jgi:hypothetical protein
LGVEHIGFSGAASCAPSGYSRGRPRAHLTLAAAVQLLLAFAAPRLCARSATVRAEFLYSPSHTLPLYTSLCSLRFVRRRCTPKARLPTHSRERLHATGPCPGAEAERHPCSPSRSARAGSASCASSLAEDPGSPRSDRGAWRPTLAYQSSGPHGTPRTGLHSAKSPRV